MKLDNRTIVEALGIIGVIGSLIFVGMQFRLEGKIARGAQYQARAESQIENFRSVWLAPENVEQEVLLFEIGLSAFQQVPTEQGSEQQELNERRERINNAGINPMPVMYRDFVRAMIQLVEIDNLLFQYQQDLLPEGYWNSARFAFKDNMKGSPMLRSVSQANQMPISDNTRTLVAEILAELNDSSLD